MLRLVLLSLLLLGTTAAMPRRSPYATPCQVRFVLQVQPRQLAASGYCRNLLDQPARYYYQLTTERWGRSRAIDTQSGSFVVGARQEAELAQAQLRATAGDHYRLRLRVFDAGGRLLAQDSVRHDL